MEHLPTIEGSPPTPRPIRLVERWRVSWHGRRDAKLHSTGTRLGTRTGTQAHTEITTAAHVETGITTTETDARTDTGTDRTDAGAGTQPPRPYLDTLRAEAVAGQQAVGTWLHRQIVPVDREAVRLLTVLDQFRRDPMDPPTASLTQVPPDDADPRPTFRIPAWVVEARQAAEAHRAYQRRITEQNVAEQQLGQLGSIRHHLIETARAAAGAHISRYQQLAGLYSAALHRRYPDRAEGFTAPAVTPEAWIHGDVPLLALEVDSKLAESYRWFLKQFATRTSANPHPPIPVEVRRAG